MWIVRESQLSALGAPERDRFVAAVDAHVRRFFPARCVALGDEGVREAITYGIERAASHGITVERYVCKYVDLMFAFGRDFDRAEPWAEEVLARAEPTSVTIDALYERAVRRARQARGICARTAEA